MSFKRTIPNLFTLGNLLFGCLAIIGIFQGQLFYASILIGIAALFDLLDGFVARLLGVSSELGKQLDSLADVVSFGVAPGMMIWALLDHSALPEKLENLKILALLIPLFSAYRLGKFNIDKRQTQQFLGFPTPATAAFILSFPLIFNQEKPDFSWISETIYNPWFLISVAIVFSWLMVTEIPFMSLKFKDLRWKGNQNRYILLLATIVLGILFQFIAIPLVIFLFILISLITAKRKKRIT